MRPSCAAAMLAEIHQDQDIDIAATRDETAEGRRAVQDRGDNPIAEHRTHLMVELDSKPHDRIGSSAGIHQPQSARLSVTSGAWHQR